MLFISERRESNSAGKTRKERDSIFEIVRERETSIVSRGSGLTALPGEVKQNISSCAGRASPEIISRMKMEGLH